MPYKRQPKGEDVNVESRTQFTPAVASAAPIAPQVTNPAGGAPSLGHTERPAPQWYQPTPIQQQPWQKNPVTPPANVSIVTPPKWTLSDVAKNEPQFVNEFKNKLWERFQNTPESQRTGEFWAGVKQNPELAAATFVRRMLTNMADANSWINGEKPPTLSTAMQTTLANHETRQWLEWVKGNGRRPKGGG